MSRAFHSLTPRFSLRSLFVFVTAASAFIALNTQPHVEFAGPILCFGMGEFDVVSLTRGWPFDYLRFEQYLPLRTGVDAINAGWPWNLHHVPLLTHVTALIGNMAICGAAAVGLAYGSGWMTQRRSSASAIRRVSERRTKVQP